MCSHLWAVHVAPYACTRGGVVRTRSSAGIPSLSLSSVFFTPSILAAVDRSTSHAPRGVRWVSDGCQIGSKSVSAQIYHSHKTISTDKEGYGPQTGCQITFSKPPPPAAGRVVTTAPALSPLRTALLLTALPREAYREQRGVLERVPEKVQAQP